ncbi:MAG: nucleotidyltransferase domain-containing protein [Armatimonadetes bacterium]|nr:nucleotidyltransferase domain-containing protein [Armatimonadota bacterium]
MASTDWGERTLTQLLGSAARVRVLACLLLPGARPMHVREIERATGLPYSAVQRELKRLEQARLVEAEQIGRARRYQVVSTSPLIPPLRDLVREGVGIIPMLRTSLARDDVELAFVYGSVAKGNDEPDSDIDVMVVGFVDDEELYRAIGAAQRQWAREISVLVYDPDEFRERLSDEGNFVTSVVRGPLIFLKGDADVLRGLAQQAEDSGD